MNVLIILSDNVYLTPYLSYYTNLLEQNSIDYDVMYWDKNKNEFISNDKYYRFSINKSGYINKLIGYIKYKHMILRQISKKSYDLIIPLHPQTSFIIYKKLIKKYHKKYIFDIRDYSYEKYCLYRKIQKKLINNSLLNVISSPGYKKFLPQGNYYICHNVPNEKNINVYQTSRRDTNKKIQISYIGLIRFMEQNIKIINFFKNDSRFQLNFVGTNSKKIEEYCKKNNIKNVTLIDTFPKNKTLEYYKQADIIMNLYGNNTPLLNYALSNKLYYSACLYKPILVCPKTYMSEIVSKYNLGYELHMKEKKELDDLYKYYNEININSFKSNSRKFMNKVYQANNKLTKKITNELIRLKKEGKND